MVNGEDQMSHYRQISIPDGIYNEAKRFVENSNNYTSVADLVKYLLRNELAKPERREKA
jgi:Arc/MetJ-type ribon-helix-helix transcriptional regulator